MYFYFLSLTNTGKTIKLHVQFGDVLIHILLIHFLDIFVEIKNLEFLFNGLPTYWK
jgi:hypothetical protein